MTNLEIVESLKKHNLYFELIKKGVISLKIDYYLQMRNAFVEYQKKGFGKMDSVTFVAMDFKVCENTVQNAVKYFKL
jgi:hypothetical protein